MAKQFEISAEDTTIKTFNRFNKFINVKSNGCWEYSGARNLENYGMFKFKHQMIRAHRFSYAFFVGKIPEGLQVCHRCDNPCCVNPDHLFLGTNQENQLDCFRKNRSNRSRLFVNDVIQIKKLLIMGVRQKTIAFMYDVDESAISKIRHNKRWGYVNVE